MITIVAKSTVKDGKKEQFIALVQELIAQSRLEAGCIAYDLYEDTQNPNVLTFIEQWQDMRAIAAHNKSAHFKAIVPQLGELRANEGEINLYKKL